MGNEFLAKKKDRETKAWRRGIARTEGDWVANASGVKRVFRARSVGPCELATNQTVVLRLAPDDKVIVSAGIHAVATITKPPTVLIEQLKKNDGIGLATVQRISEATDRVDLLTD